MKTVGCSEAKAHFSERTKRGRPVAKLSPVSKNDLKSISEVFTEIDKLRKGAVLGDDLSIRELIEDGRHQ
ncbi:MAG TPA: type II toxin-antitoxin system prevent-host-death family antitoxin [Verrucomicrobia bacterium]|jgi:antitoxin (DNA-binding transcriptional repressor) of toxin-antitoxin stability system|nr:type II toxin-antitoxin system prevent-host-death family antitoxin [Candidatus Manganitrophaceae bacterium]HIL71110.1 type II toxin-antitoxin system prevent-host-death family antitoxin [Verrucomicrobiota bacterium]